MKPEQVVGLYGLRFDDGYLQYQFRVVGRGDDGDYRVQYFSFRSGSPGPTVCAKKEDLFDTRHVEFYFNESEWQDACAEYRPRPYGADDDPDHFDKWLRERGWVFEPKARCLHWLKSGNCGPKTWHAHGQWHWMDHVSGYIDDEGKRVLLLQPYELYDINSLYFACAGFDLEAVINTDGWYGHGTFCIELRQKKKKNARA